MNDKKSLDDCEIFITEARSHKEQIPFVLVGTKADLTDGGDANMFQEQIKELQEKYGCPYFTSSAKWELAEPKNQLNAAFSCLAQKVLEKQRKVSQQIIASTNSQAPTKSIVVEPEIPKKQKKYC